MAFSLKFAKGQKYTSRLFISPLPRYDATMTKVKNIKNTPYFYSQPKRQAKSPFVFASPHSGEEIPKDMLDAIAIEAQDLKQSQDCRVNELFKSVPDNGVPLLAARYARTYVDLNRYEGEIDATMFQPRPQVAGQCERVEIGLGVIPRIVTADVSIYDEPMPAEHIDKRLNLAYHPYHAKLKQLLDDAQERAGKAILIDCHSMPSNLFGWSKRNALPDVVLGNCRGRSCSSDLILKAEGFLKEMGLRVRRNVPYAGGYCTQFYGQPDRGVHALQIELNRGLYMNEKSREPNENFKELQQKLGLFVANLIASEDKSAALAAE